MHRALRLAAAGLTLACSRGADAPKPEPHPATAPARTISIGPGVSLESLDWGGKGPVLVFLGGLGSTAHVFDEFAPRFTDSFHVVGITRRGFGASAGSAPSSNLDTLVADIRAVLDTLGLRSVTLVGHSIAGEEMTRFGETDAKRCAGLIYLDAAYDRTGWSSPGRTPPPLPAPRSSATDFASFAAVRAYHVRVMGVREPESEIRATSRFDGSGHYTGEVTPGDLKASVIAAVRAPRYDRVSCRSLAIYAAPDSLADVVPYYAELDAAGRVQGDTLLKFVASLVAESHARFAQFPQHQAIDINGGNHFIFLQRPDEVARAMRGFLSNAAELRSR